MSQPPVDGEAVRDSRPPSGSSQAHSHSHSHGAPEAYGSRLPQYPATTYAPPSPPSSACEQRPTQVTRAAVLSFVSAGIAFVFQALLLVIFRIFANELWPSLASAALAAVSVAAVIMIVCGSVLALRGIDYFLLAGGLIAQLAITLAAMLTSNLGNAQTVFFAPLPIMALVFLFNDRSTGWFRLKSAERKRPCDHAAR
ncbi:hypothetical protein EH165_10360 [Nakamurella antarctica]|uniref:Uncharacterized protein n=1 Tax=Nakamurella antarctica TaxID=1902245 RepID=A0A3G8ZNU6_9ACTN|nr:hypothetical protein [Nakamurella antarctica]AZI58477.1 hypothetical protein EH165_10360 [Nakamurella antarctica]